MQLSLSFIPVHFAFLGGTGGVKLCPAAFVWHGSKEISGAHSNMPSTSAQGLLHWASCLQLCLSLLPRCTFLIS